MSKSHHRRVSELIALLVEIEGVILPNHVLDFAESTQKTAEWANGDFKPLVSWKPAVLIATVLGGGGATVCWFLINSWLPVLFVGLGIFLGMLGGCLQIAEVTAVGGILGKSLAWYLAPTLYGLSSFEVYGISIGIAAILEYPFLCIANSISLKLKTGLRLRAIQDATDVATSFALIAYLGSAAIDVFAIVQMILAFVRVIIAYFGPMIKMCSTAPQCKCLSCQRCRSNTDPQIILHELRQQLISKPIDVPEEVVLWIDSEIARLPAAQEAIKNSRHNRFLSKGFVTCFIFTVLGLALGLVGITVLDDPYVVGVAGILGMTLAWYLAPSLEAQPFLLVWIASVSLSATLEYPFLTTANIRAAASGETFQLRSIQDLVGLVASTLLITILSRASLTWSDVAQLLVGVLRVVVASRFFNTISHSF